MNNQQSPNVSTGGPEPVMPIADLIRAHCLQIVIAQSVIKHLEQSLSNQNTVLLQNLELEHLKQKQVTWEIKQLQQLQGQTNDNV